MLISRQLVQLHRQEREHLYIWVCDLGSISMVFLVSPWNPCNLNVYLQMFGLRLPAHWNLSTPFGSYCLDILTWIQKAIESHIKHAVKLNSLVSFQVWSRFFIHLQMFYFGPASLLPLVLLSVLFLLLASVSFLLIIHGKFHKAPGFFILQTLCIDPCFSFFTVMSTHCQSV